MEKSGQVPREEQFAINCTTRNGAAEVLVTAVPHESGVGILARVLFGSSHRIPVADEFTDIACLRGIDRVQVTRAITVLRVLTHADKDRVGKKYSRGYE